MMELDPDKQDAQVLKEEMEIFDELEQSAPQAAASLEDEDFEKYFQQEKQKHNITTMTYLKFIVLSLIGVFLFFIPVKGPATPIVVAINTFKGFLGNSLPWIVTIMIVALNVTLFLGRIVKVPVFVKYHENDRPFRVTFFITSLIIILMIWFKVNLPPIVHPMVGGRLLIVASNVVTTIAVAGWAVVFILRSGIVVFLGTLVEPLMRPIFKLPGEAAVNALASFVSAASVGIYLTDMHYRQKFYTEQEGVNTALNYSVVSLGFMALLCTLNGIEQYYGTLIIWSFIITMLMAVITCRIPPVTWKRQVYVDGRQQTPEDRRAKKVPFSVRFRKALLSGAIASEEFTVNEFFRALINALVFAQKIIAVMVTVVLVALTLVYFTPIFEYLGKPVVPILQLLGIPEAAKVAPSTLICFIEITLPSILVSNYGLPHVSGFFVALLSCCQIIFMTEAGNAMLSSSMPIKFSDLVVAFLVRTAIALPICAVVAKLVIK